MIASSSEIIKSQKRICFLSLNPAAPWGGSEELWHQTAITLHKKGYLVSVIFLDWKSQQSNYLSELELLGIKVFKIIFINTVSVRMRRLLNGLLGDFQQMQLQKAFINLQPDLIVYTNMAPRGAETLAYAIKMGIPYVFDIQLADELLWHSSNPLMIDCYKNAKAVYFLSDKNKNAAEKQLGIKLLNAKRHFNPIKSSTNISPLIVGDVIKFACIGRMGVEHKRQDLLLEILASENWRNRNWELYFCGSGEHEYSLKQLVKMYDLESKVFFKGQVNDIDAVWNDCHALLLPSTYEGMSLAVLECMQAGRVAIVTAAGGNEEYIKNGINGFIAEAASVNLFDSAMEDAWQQIDNWTLIGQRAKDKLVLMVPNNAADYFAEEIVSYL